MTMVQDLPQLLNDLCRLIYIMSNFQIDDLKGLFGLLMVNMQLLRAKFKVLDLSFGNSTGNTRKQIFFQLNRLEGKEY